MNQLLKNLFEREYGLKVFIKDLKNEWNELIEEAKKNLDTDEEHFITFRMALLIFALRRMPPSHSPFFKKFKKEIKYYI